MLDMNFVISLNITGMKMESVFFLREWRCGPGLSIIYPIIVIIYLFFYIDKNIKIFKFIYFSKISLTFIQYSVGS